MSNSDTKSTVPSVDDPEDEDMEREDVDEEGVIKPWDPKQIRITTKNFTIREVFIQLTDEELDLAPDFQRSFIWDERRQTRLIESILLGIPLPAFYFNQDALGGHQVIDGVQRLTTIKMFMSNLLPLSEVYLEYLKAYQGLTYDTLDAPIRRQFAKTQIVAHVIEPQTPDEVKYDIFSRVNTGGSPLTAQEIRHCMSKDRSRRLLKSLVERDSFDRATGWMFWGNDADGQSIRNSNRMADREMALRFCAFHTTSISDYENASSLDAFLLDFTKKIDTETLPMDALSELESAFERAMINCSSILGDAAFRRWPPDASRRGPINRAVFESQALAMAGYELDQLLPYKAQIVSAFRNLFEDLAYDSAVRAGTGNPRKVEYRLDAPRRCLAEILA